MGSCISSQKALTLHEDPTPDVIKTEAGPIERMPDDVLYLVFSFVATAEPIRGIHDLSQQLPGIPGPSYLECLGWMRLSAVCRRWRAVLATSAPLWADTVFNLPPEAASLALTRSSGAPLDIHIPFVEDLHLTFRNKVVSSKSWGAPHTHRVRLMSLAIAHASRMRKLYAADLSAEQYQKIFKCGTFNSLRVIVLRRGYYNDETPTPTREELGRLDVSAPNVYRAYLSAALPIAPSDGPGLSFQLPGLRDLSVSTTLSRPTTAEQLRWIPTLIRGARGLQRLKMHIPVDFYVNWKDLCGEEPLDLPQLRAVEISGSLKAHLDDLFNQISTVTSIPPSVFSSSSGDMDRTNILEFVSTYGKIVARSLKVHPLDTMYISRGTRNDFHAAFSVTAFSSQEVPGPYHNLEDLTQNIYSRAHTAARLSAFFSWLIMGDEDRAGDALNVLAPILVENSIKHLIIDELSTTQWEAAVPGFMRSCLSKVTTLYCIDSRNPVGKPLDMYPCTAALRRLKLSTEPGAPNEEDKAVDHVLPALDTVVVSMASKPDEKYWTVRNMGDVREWWDELIRALSYRDSAGLRVHKLRIVGDWTSERISSRMVKLDAKMLARAAALVDELVDERTTPLRDG